MIVGLRFAQSDLRSCHRLLPVVLGTTLGMTIANVPVVMLGNFTADRLPVRAIHVAAIGIAVLGGLELGL